MMKSLLLAGAAGLATVSLAQAADVPMDKAEAVEYVKVCSEFGAGFFYIPGTDTCLKIAGRVRADYEYSDNSATTDSTEDNVGFDSSAMLNFDARTATELGQLRSYIEVSGGDGKSLSVDKAFIQLGGLTAGYATSMFDSGIGTGDGVVGFGYASDKTTNLLAYTATFGGGFYATISIEDGVNRRSSLTSYSANVASSTGTNAIVSTATSQTYAGHDIPDVVFALGASQDWGAVKVMGAVHDVGYASSTLPDDDFGYALGAAVELKLAGITLGVQGNYADGAMAYLDGTSAPDAVAYTGSGATVANVSETSTGYTLATNLGFALSSAVGANVYGTYRSVDWATPGTILADLAGDGTTVAINTKEEAYAFGANLTYTITTGLSVQVEAAYQNVDVTKVTAGASPSGAATTSKSSTDTTAFGVRLQRVF